ncbi:MAG: hypothetical protein HC767_06270 [Akkermansiaceae bacterium]|nr:hypothetical protein [Akkermansiaceae bacterium]
MLSDPSSLLPWEEGCITRSDRKKLGMFRRPILQLLQREPSHRITVEQFSLDLASIYEHHTDTQTHTHTRTAHTSDSSL